MSELKILEGYKQTEVGVIPTDWEVVSLGDIGNCVIGLTYSPNDVSKFGTLVLRSSNVQNGQLAYKDNVYVDMSLPERVMVKEGDILICVRNGSRRLIGKCALIDENSEGNAFGAFMSIFRTNLYPFIFYQFQSNLIQNQIQENMGATINQITNKDLKSFKLMIPKNIAEQTAIATALSDVDNLIQSLEKLIAKKEAIKTGTMQQLLTGKTRLPEFATREDGSAKWFKQTELGWIPEDWDVKSYADIFTFLSTSSNSRADLSNSGDYGYIHYGDIHTKWHTRLDLSKTSLPKISENLVTSAFVQHGDIVIADASEDYEGVGKSIEISNQSAKPVVSGLHTFLLRDKNGQLSDGFRGLISDIPVVKASIQRLATGLKVYGISKKNLITVMIPVPDTKEQTAIATILSDMDTEIQALQQRLEKTRDIKQGMMQQLLTGKVRLVTSSAESDTQTLANKDELPV